MGIHSIIEPSGTLLTGWGLVDRTTPSARADLRNADQGQPVDPAQGDRTPAPVTRSKWELRKVG